MQFSTFKTTLANWLTRTDLTSYLADFANIALHELENMDINGRSWRYMEYRGTTTSSQNTITFPTSLKTVRMLRAYDASNNVYYPPLEPRSIEQLMLEFPDQSNLTGPPKVYAWQQYTGEFVIAPKVTQEWTYETVCYKYSSDLSGDSDTNWWLNYHWDVLLWGALIAAEPFIKNDQRIPVWREKYQTALNNLMLTEVAREWSTGPLNIAVSEGPKGD